ncbi:MAG: fibronectin type III domain-containing protein [Chitinophagaceae bacterium]
MRKLSLLLLLVASSTYSLLAQNKIIARGAEEIKGTLIRVTQPLRNFSPDQTLLKDIPVRDENGIINSRKIPRITENYPEQNNLSADPALQQQYNDNSIGRSAATIGANFNGMGYTSVNPPDPTLCVGPNHVVQMINGNSGAYLKVFNKTGGQIVAQTFLDNLTGRGGLGDPIALYDQLADRFVLIEFANKAENGNQEGLIFAISQSNDPSGAWFVYFFGYGNTFPDYPKVSVWNDAYYATTNDFANATSYSGSSVWAFDRAKMLAGDNTATTQRFTLGNTNKFFSMCPVLWQGSTAPVAGSGGLIGYMQDNAWTSSSTDVDSIGLLEFNVNFASAGSSTVTHKSSMAVSSFKSDICSATRGRCISQSGSTIALEALHQKVQNQPVYRNFGTYEGIVFTHLVDKGASIAGIRWYELKKTTGNWGINQESTFSPDNTHRWLPSICYDKFGNIGLGYNVSSSATGVFPGVRFTGRKECDPLSTMTYTEQTIVNGTAANGSNRYGDYNHLVADPDGSTFWLTAEWNSASTWNTRVASFTLDRCNAVACTDPTGLTATSITTTSATIAWTVVSGATNYDVDYKLASSATWINAATATTSLSVALSTLTSNSLYDCRVRANCTAGSSNYVQAQFTTQAIATCSAPAGLSSGSITTSSASVTWSAVSGAVNYDVDYKTTATATWINAATATTSTSVSLSGLSPTTSYDWRVRTNCSSLSSGYSIGQFTTAAVSTCPGVYDISTNGTRAGAGAIPFNVDVKGLISPSGDNDYYSFVITNGGTINLTLTTLPLDYDLRLYRNNSQVAISQNGGSSSETINYTATTGTYYARVYGFNNANNASVCYTLKVQLGTASMPGEFNGAEILSGRKISVFPNPVNELLNINITGLNGKAFIKVFDINGRLVANRSTTQINSTVDVKKLSKGVYYISIDDANGKVIHRSKFVKQ